ncbi:MAG: hypothetical protein IPN95_16485 [Bacteroidetes bacterium]|nr:hypothetical protein [Bacteroidota bacterium]MBL0016426.1 hypothetical protein [Bacteroidota bacterium]MBP6639562.1 hypothetical protein [Bacteroidia bacterium]
MQKSFIDSILELRSFMNRKDVSSNYIAFLLGKPRSAHMFGAIRVKPFDARYISILVNMKPQNFNVIRFITFTCTENVNIGLADLVEKFGPCVATFDEAKNTTTLTCTNFGEEELIESLFCTIEGFHMENTEGGLLLHQGGGQTVVVPFSELMIPEFTFTFKEFERPQDKSGKNPIYAR